jgi:hypothetical protein
MGRAKKSVLKAFAFLSATVIGSISCTYGVYHLALNYPAPTARTAATGPGGPVISAISFEAEKPAGGIVGEIYAKSDKPGPVWYLDNDLGGFLKEAFTAELIEAGVPVASDGQRPSAEAFRAQGRALLFHAWAASADAFFTAAVNIEVTLLSKDQPVFQQGFVSKKTAPLMNPDARALLGEATMDVMKQAAGAIRQFLGREKNRDEK